MEGCGAGGSSVDALDLYGVLSIKEMNEAMLLASWDSQDEIVLPDEVLMLIFSLLTDASTLLDVLPLVSKQWYRVARHPASWAGIHFRFHLICDFMSFNMRPEPVDLNAASIDDVARLLLHAPAAASLCFGSMEKTTPRLLSAISRTRAVVRRFCCYCLSAPDWDYVLPFLYMQRDLRELRLLLHNEVLKSRPNSRIKPFLVQEAPAQVAYSGELAARLPQLRELHLHWKSLECRLPDGLIGDLVRGAAKLRVLDVDMPQGPDLDACAELVGVQHVTVLLKERALDTCGRMTPAVLHAVELCAAMKASLRSATFLLHRGYMPMVVQLRTELAPVCISKLPSVALHFEELTSYD